MREIKLKRRNRFAAAWKSYFALRKLGHFDRLMCLRLALSHFTYKEKSQ